MTAVGLREAAAPASLTAGCLRFLLLPTGCCRCCTAAVAAAAGVRLRRGSASAAETSAGAAAGGASAAGSGGQGGASTGGEDSLAAAAAAAAAVPWSLQPSELSSELLLKPGPFARPPAAAAVGLTAPAWPLARRLLAGRLSSRAPTGGGGDVAAVGLAPRAGLRSPEVARASLERCSIWCRCRRRWLRPRAGLCAGAARQVGCWRSWRPQYQASSPALGGWAGLGRVTVCRARTGLGALAPLSAGRFVGKMAASPACREWNQLGEGRCGAHPQGGAGGAGVRQRPGDLLPRSASAND